MSGSVNELMKSIHPSTHLPIYPSTHLPPCEIATYVGVFIGNHLNHSCSSVQTDVCRSIDLKSVHLQIDTLVKLML
jgi:hypothetical protein